VHVLAPLGCAFAFLKRLNRGWCCVYDREAAAPTVAMPAGEPAPHAEDHACHVLFEVFVRLVWQIALARFGMAV
jgi:hypothetical protein